MKVLLLSLALAGFVFLTLAQTTARTTARTTAKTTAKTTTRASSTTKAAMTTKPSATSTTKPSQTTKPGTTKVPATTTTRPTTTTRRTRAPTTPHQLVDDEEVGMAIDYLVIMLYNYMGIPDLPEVYESTEIDEMMACITPEQKDEFSQVMKPCKTRTDVDMVVCFFLSLLMDPTGTRLEQSNMIYFIDYTNLTSSQETGAIARMQKCYKEEMILTEDLNIFLNILAAQTMSDATGSIIQNMLNGRNSNCQAAEASMNKLTDDLHVWKAMACIFEGLLTNGCPQIKTPTKRRG